MQSGRLYIIATEYHTTDSKQILISIRTVNNNAAVEDKRTKQKIHPFFAQKGKVDCCFLEQIFFSFTLLIVLSCTADNLCDLGRNPDYIIMTDTLPGLVTQEAHSTVIPKTAHSTVPETYRPYNGPYSTLD